MATAYTSILGLALPVTGELSGTWGTTVNTGITQLLEDAVAGTTTLSSDADVTLTDTDGASNQQRAAILLWTASGSVTRNITASAQSKVYVVINATGGSQSIVLRGAGPTTGITVAAAEKCLAAWNGSDFVKVASSTTATLAIASGGTGQTSATAAFDALSPTTTTGDLIYYNGTDNVRLAIGATNKVLTVSGGIPTWADAPGGSMVYPGAGIAVSTGSAWDTSKTNPTGAFVGTTDSQTLTNKTLSTGSTWNGNVVGVLYGGTGQTTATLGFNALSPLTTQGDILYHNGTNNVRLAKGTASQVLRMNSGATAPEWASGVTTPVAVADGGTGQTTATAGFDALAPTTTQGDLIYHNGTDNVRLAKGAVGTNLRMNDGATAPEWYNGLKSNHGSTLAIGYLASTGACGVITITGDTSTTASTVGGAVTIAGGTGLTNTGGALNLYGGSGGTGASGGAVNIYGGAVAGSAAGASINLTASNGSSNPGGDIVFTVGTGSANGYVTFTNTDVANGSVATAMSSVGPTGASTTIQGWLRIKVGGTVRYMPFW